MRKTEHRTNRTVLEVPNCPECKQPLDEIAFTHTAFRVTSGLARGEMDILFSTHRGALPNRKWEVDETVAKAMNRFEFRCAKCQALLPKNLRSLGGCACWGFDWVGLDQSIDEDDESL